MQADWTIRNTYLYTFGSVSVSIVSLNATFIIDYSEDQAIRKHSCSK